MSGFIFSVHIIGLKRKGGDEDVCVPGTDDWRCLSFVVVGSVLLLTTNFSYLCLSLFGQLCVCFVSALPDGSCFCVDFRLFLRLTWHYPVEVCHDSPGGPFVYYTRTRVYGVNVLDVEVHGY